MQKAQGRLSSKSETAGAIRYALARWHALTRYAEDGLSRSTTVLPNGRYEPWRSAGKTSFSLDPIAAENGPQPCTPSSAQPSSTVSTRSSTSAPCSEASRTTRSAASANCSPGTSQTRSKQTLHKQPKTHATGVRLPPTSACLNTAIICSTEKRFFLIQSLPYPGQFWSKTNIATGSNLPGPIIGDRILPQTQPQPKTLPRKHPPRNGKQIHPATIRSPQQKPPHLACSDAYGRRTVAAAGSVDARGLMSCCSLSAGRELFSHKNQRRSRERHQP